MNGNDVGGGVVVDPPAIPYGPGGSPRWRPVVDDVPVRVISQRVQYYDRDGNLITESLKDYTRRTVRREFASLDAFLNLWSNADRKEAIVDELEKRGIFLDALAEEVGKDLDYFDLVCHVGFDRPPLTRRERATTVRKRDYFARYGERAREVIGALLDKYADEGIVSIENLNVLKVRPFDALGTPTEIIDAFGGKQSYLEALRELEREIYLAA